MTFENYKSRVIVERINGSRFDKFRKININFSPWICFDGLVATFLLFEISFFLSFFVPEIRGDSKS